MLKSSNKINFVLSFCFLPLLAKIEAAPKPDLSALQQTFDPDAQKKVQELLLS